MRTKKAKISEWMIHRLKSRGLREGTFRQYKAAVLCFEQWIYDQLQTYRVEPGRYHDLIQQYVKELDEQGRSAATIHTHLAALCRATGEPMSNYEHPRRGMPVRGRGDGGKRTSVNFRIYDIAPLIGIRQAEYGRLRGRDLIRRDGSLYVVVERGKGGKYHEQLILPEHEVAVKAVFGGVGRDDYAFTKEEAKGTEKANLHAFRRDHARAVYAWYCNLPEEEKAIWRERMRERYRGKFRKIIKENPVKGESRFRAAWEKELRLIREKPRRYCRGEYAESLREQGRDIWFSREAVLFVSLFSLAHFRESVTVNNYLV